MTYSHIHHNPREKREQRWFARLSRHQRTRRQVYSAVRRAVHASHVRRAAAVLARVYGTGWVI